MSPRSARRVAHLTRGFTVTDADAARIAFRVAASTIRDSVTTLAVGVALLFAACGSLAACVATDLAVRVRGLAFAGQKAK
jgi:hypothetical protein